MRCVTAATHDSLPRTFRRPAYATDKLREEIGDIESKGHTLRVPSKNQ